MDKTVFAIFGFVYLGMFLGGIPGLALDRTGVALVGAIALLIAGKIEATEAWLAVDVSTIALLFGLMIVSAQLRLGGFYVAVTRWIASLPVQPRLLLAILIAIAALLSAILANDIVCLAMTPILIEGCAQRRLNPLPYLLGLACASNIGSAMTLIGNPQNMLIGQTLRLSFSAYLGDAVVPSMLSLGFTWAILAYCFNNHWESSFTTPLPESIPFNGWQTAKGLAVVLVLMIVFLFIPVPRDVSAMGAAGLLLMSRKMASRQIIGLVDWHLLVLFIGLFMINHTLSTSGNLALIVNTLERFGIDLAQPAWLFSITAVLSNMVSNVPAVMLLLPFAEHEPAGSILALSSTLAGNLIVVGSIANIIVIEKAREMGVEVSWVEHAKIGIPVTIGSLVIAAAWLSATA